MPNNLSLSWITPSIVPDPRLKPDQAIYVSCPVQSCVFRTCPRIALNTPCQISLPVYGVAQDARGKQREQGWICPRSQSLRMLLLSPNGFLAVQTIEESVNSNGRLQVYEGSMASPEAIDWKA